LSLVQKEEHSDSYGIYFLLGENHGVKERREVYVGKSKLTQVNPGEINELRSDLNIFN